MRGNPDVDVDVVSYSSAIMACERSERCEEALLLFEDMKAASLQPTAYIYTVMTVAVRRPDELSVLPPVAGIPSVLRSRSGIHQEHAAVRLSHCHSQCFKRR
jgi:pentatricopeptide repeat protein